MVMVRVLALLMVFVAGSVGYQTSMFSDPFGEKKDFEEMQKKFTKLIRWGAIDEASVFVVEEQRDAFLELSHDLTDMRFTDYEVLILDYDGKAKTAKATVRYTGYRLSRPIEESFRMKQEWARDAGTGAWAVTLNVDELEQALSGMPAKRAN